MSQWDARNNSFCRSGPANQNEVGSKPTPGRFDPENPVIQKLAKEYGLSPEEYLADPNAHSGQSNETSELDTSIEEWKKALEVASTASGYTVAELSEKLQIPESTLRRKLRNLVAAGKCTVGGGRRTSANGRSDSIVTVYQLKGKEK